MQVINFLLWFFLYKIRVYEFVCNFYKNIRFSTWFLRRSFNSHFELCFHLYFNLNIRFSFNRWKEIKLLACQIQTQILFLECRIQTQVIFLECRIHFRVPLSPLYHITILASAICLTVWPLTLKLKQKFWLKIRVTCPYVTSNKYFFSSRVCVLVLIRLLRFQLYQQSFMHWRLRSTTEIMSQWCPNIVTITLVL